MDFRRIAARGGSQDLAFEELVCQLFHRRPDVPAGSRYRRLNGAGGDGGVEAVWTLPDGSEWGVQAKYLFDIGRVTKQAEESLVTALSLRPRLTRFVIHIPFDLAPPTSRKGESASEKFDTARDRWVQQARDAGKELEVVLETASFNARQDRPGCARQNRPRGFRRGSELGSDHPGCDGHDEAAVLHLSAVVRTGSASR